MQNCMPLSTAQHPATLSLMATCRSAQMQFSSPCRVTQALQCLLLTAGCAHSQLGLLCELVQLARALNMLAEL